ncbi:MAG: hypothetical protein KAI17_06005 [Thiotrichaceae bacterium]|nr:hypothetical protein [Thiotrichaceae bacterium]
MNDKRLKLNTREMLGFRLINETVEVTTKQTNLGSKIGDKNTIGSKIGGKIGVKPGDKAVIASKMGAKVSLKSLA